LVDRSKVVNLLCLRRLDQTDAGTQVRQIVFGQMQIGVLVDTKLFDAPEIDRAGPAVSAVNPVALVKEELRKVSAVLA
jgi:hypothetical protein